MKDIMDQKLLEYILYKCKTTINFLSKSTGIPYSQLYGVEYSDRKLKDKELKILSEYLKKETTLKHSYIDTRINKILKRNSIT